MAMPVARRGQRSGNPGGLGRFPPCQTGASTQASPRIKAPTYVGSLCQCVTRSWDFGNAHKFRSSTRSRGRARKV
eukprot:2131407-Prymnesium_polylepis.1